jgi:hypothetical protein
MVGAPIKTTVVTPPAAAQKPKLTSPTREGGRRNGRPATLICVLVSLWIVWHFSGIFLAALSIGTTSNLVMRISQGEPGRPSMMQRYLDALYLNQGHSFFAPEVGPGHVIHFELFDGSNQRIGEGTLPDKKEQWPRLLYHRHMMLADQVEAPSENEADKQAGAFGRIQLEAYARQLLRQNRGAQTCRVQLFAHWPLPSFFLDQGRPAGYQRLAREMSQSGQNHQINEQGFELVAEAVQRRSDLPPEPDPPAEQESKKQSFAPPSPANPNLNWRSDRPSTAGRWSGGPRR